MRLLSIAALVVGALALTHTLTSSCPAGPPPPPPPGAPAAADVLRCKKLVILDDAGRERVVATAAGNVAGVWVGDRKGAAVAAVFASEQFGAAFGLYRDAHKGGACNFAVAAGPGSASPTLQVIDAAGQLRIGPADPLLPPAPKRPAD